MSSAKAQLESDTRTLAFEVHFETFVSILASGDADEL